MNTLHFKYALEIERTGSITHAAENLFISQPSLSKAIKDLEDSIGFEIFERTAKGMVLTKKGAEFMVYARSIVDKLKKIENLANNDSDIQSFNISIPRGSYIADAFTKFVSELNTDKDIDVNIQETNSIQAINNVVEGRFNLAIIRYQTTYENYFLDYLEERNLCSDLIWEFEYLVLLSKNHPLSAAKEIKYRDLSKFIEIVHGDTAIPYISSNEVKKDTERSSGKRIYVYERSNQFDLLSNIYTTYMWVSPIPKRYLGLYNLVQRRCHVANHKYKDLLIFNKGYKLSTLDHKFINKLYESKNEVAFIEYT